MHCLFSLSELDNNMLVKVLIHLLLMLVNVLTQVVGMSHGFRSPVNDDSWHTVFLRRQVDTFQLRVDDRKSSPVTGQFRFSY